MSALAATESPSRVDHRDRVRALNDSLRTTGRGGRIVLTRSISELSHADIGAILTAVARFDAFTPDNDPHGAHDCAGVTVGVHNILWKIDSYDRACEFHSPDPADPAATTRVLTIMLAEEY